MQVTKGLQLHTINNYYISLATFLRWLASRGEEQPHSESADLSAFPVSEIIAVTQEDIYEFLEYCAQQRKCGPGSCATKLSAIRAFYHWLCTHDYGISVNPAKGIPTPHSEKKPARFLSGQEVLKLVNASGQGETPARDTCILTLFLCCGISLTELVRLNLQDLQGNALVITGSSGRQRMVFLNGDAMAAVKNWQAERDRFPHIEDNEAFFISHRTGNRLAGRTIQQIAEKNLSRAGLKGKGYSPDRLRQTAAVMLANSGALDAAELQSMLGTKTPGSVSRYLNASSQRLRDGMTGFSLHSLAGEEPGSSPDELAAPENEKTKKKDR